MIITGLLITERWFFGSSVGTPNEKIRSNPVGNGKEQMTANTPPMSSTVPQPLLPTSGEIRKHFTGLSSAETPAKRRRYGSLSELEAPFSLEPAQMKKYGAPGVALDLGQQVEKSNKEVKTLAQSNDSPVCRCDDRVPKTWKLFVEDDSLVPLGEALFYLAASKLGSYGVCIKHRIKLGLKLQLRQVDSLTLLTRVDTIWKNRDSKTLKRFVNMKCRQKWWQFDGKVLLDETAVTKYQINRHRVCTAAISKITIS